MSPPPADSPESERPPPWWRHRRRLFYLAVVIVPVATLWGGWVWWYRAGFPVPSEALGMNDATHQTWIIEPRWELIDWKARRETHRLRLSGTVWREKGADITLTFGADGRLAVAGAPGWEDRLRSKDPFSVPVMTDSIKAALASLHRSPYQFYAGESVGSFPHFQPNLYLPETPWNGRLLATSSREIYLDLDPKTESEGFPDVYLRLTRVPTSPLRPGAALTVPP